MVGRLIEIDLRHGYRTVQDVEDLTGSLTATLDAVASTVRPIIVADWRSCGVLTPSVAERAVAMMAGVNARIERSAILHSEDASTSVLQLMRLIRETEADYRRLFTDAAQLQQWLRDLLTEAERERLRAFLFFQRSSRVVS